LRKIVREFLRGKIQLGNLDHSSISCPFALQARRAFL
jgi:hypothetical protein